MQCETGSLGSSNNVTEEFKLIEVEAKGDDIAVQQKKKKLTNHSKN